MQRVDAHRAGLALGSLIGLIHLLWVFLVAAGWAGALVRLSLKLHFLSVPFTLLSFDASRAAALVTLSAVVGYLVGFVLGSLWNAFRVR